MLVDCGSQVVVAIRLRPFDGHRHPNRCRTGTAVALDSEAGAPVAKSRADSENSASASAHRPSATSTEP